MSTLRAFLMLTLSLLTVAGCDSQSFQKNPGENGPFGKVKLGMSQGEAMEAAPGRGFGRGYDQLGVNPAPRARFPKLPKDTEWFLWKGTETDPMMVLGIAEGKVVFKEVITRIGNSGTSESAALPQYHGKE